MKILLVEDELELANFLRRGFKYEGYEVVHVSDGGDVFQAIKKKQFDLIILDLILPSINGEKVLKKLRMEGDTTPVIVLTALNDIDTKTRLLNLGADDYLIKPFSFVELIARIKSVYRRTHEPIHKPEQIKVGDLVMDPARRLVTRAGKTINLRLKEYDLLEYFMRNPDRVINRSNLVEKVWDYDAKLFSNTVDSHVSLLRKKINEGSKKKLIETIHGIGYILRSE